jgi:hypothetical protein
MANIDPDLNELRNILDGLSKYTPQDFIRPELGSELNFESGLLIIERYLKLYSDLRECNLENLPIEVIRNLKNQGKNAFQKFTQIIDYAPRQHSSPFQERDRIINELQSSYASQWNVIAPVIAYSIRKGTDFESLEKRARENIARQEDAIKEFGKQRDNTLEEIQKTLESVRRAAADVGVSQHSLVFKEAAEEYEKKSKGWLTATISLSIATAIWGAFSFFIHPPGDPPTTAQIIQFSIAKLIVLSALYYSLVWAARNYQAHKHNYIVNRHRQNALQTFETFIKAAQGDPDTKNAVLLQTTQSIFSAQPSGYIHKDTESDSPNKFIELIRAVGSTGNKT